MLGDCSLLVGLGNPGDRYSGNRHNVGFRIVDAIAQYVAGVSFRKMENVADVASFISEKRKVVLAKPLTFVNLSGRAVRFLVDFFKIPLERTVVFHDDIDLPFGRVKIKKGGGNGGHNGLKSIDSLVGVDYWRVRIGVGRPSEKSMIVSYVLGDFSEEERDKLTQVESVIVKNLSLLNSNDIKNLEKLINS